MPRFSRQLPSGETTTDDFARELVLFLGYTAPDGSNNADDARVIGAQLAAAHARLDDAGRENFTTLASELLPEWEDTLRVTPAAGSTTEARRAALTAVRRSTAGNNRVRFLAALRAIDPTATLVTSSIEANLTYPRGRYVVSVRVAPAVLNDDAQRARIVDVVERMLRAPMTYQLSSNEGFFYNDPDSTFDSGDTLAR